MNAPEAAALTPAELLEATGQTSPPVLLRPIIERFLVEHVQYEYVEQTFAKVVGRVLYLPRPIRARQPGVNLAIAHDLRQWFLGIPGRADDRAYPHLAEQERAFDRWARELVLPAPWFRADALARTPVKALALRYNVSPFDAIDRAQDLEVTPLVCRDRESYPIYLRHPWWVGRRTAYFGMQRRCEVLVAGKQACGLPAAVVHHLPSGYDRLGRELDDDLRAVCAQHHLGVHPEQGQLALWDDAEITTKEER
jgi:hypothetical protein